MKAIGVMEKLTDMENTQKLMEASTKENGRVTVNTEQVMKLG